ncbi:MAG: hypothetical protein PHR45_05615 [Muribaculaceae bacterium]|nr:hypothetical protein [Muribaculaceae bacterium]
MKIGIHKKVGSYSDRWIEYCKENNIDYKIVNAYDSNIVEQLVDCDIFMWHHHHANYRDALFAKQLLNSLETAGKKVFPDFKTDWHFDDKLGQKYLFEALGIQAAPSYAFYDKKSAKKWIDSTTFPKVFKLRGGAGSANVQLAKSKKDAVKFVNKCFSRGFSQFDGIRNFKERIKHYRNSKDTLFGVFKGFGRMFIKTEFAKMHPKEKGYAYFQEFIPNDGYDIRIEIVEDKAIALIRKARKNDFRASGGHMDYFNHEYITPDVIKFAFDVYDKLSMQSCAMDLVRNNIDGKLYVVEVCYCYGVDDDEFDHGYWDRDGNLHNEKFNGLDLMIESVIKN